MHVYLYVVLESSRGRMAYASTVTGLLNIRDSAYAFNSSGECVTLDIAKVSSGQRSASYAVL